jgi:hypothetical protein
MKRSEKVKSYMDAVAEIGCIICNKDCWGKLELHYKSGAGMGLKASDYDIIPLCFNHHSAQTRLPYGHAVHKGTKPFEQNYGKQDYLITKTRAIVKLRHPEIEIP